jgi:uncharacterized membrane protein YjfL (UPF0719 family)
MNEFLKAVEKLPSAFSAVAIAAILIVVGKIFYLAANPRRRSSNNAIYIGIAGYLVAIGIALNCGVKLTGGEQWSIGTVAIGGALSILFLKLSMLVNDKILVYKFDNTTEIVNNNVAVAIVEASGLISIGFMLRGVLMSDSASFSDKFIDVFAYWLIGQVLFAAGGLIYQALGHGDTNQRLKDGDIGTAFAFGGFLIAYAMTIEAAITGATSNILGELPMIAVFSLVGLVILLIASKIVGTIFVESKDRVIGTSVIAAAILVSLGFVFAGATDSSITANAPTIETTVDAKLTVPTTTETPPDEPTKSGASESKTVK